MILLLPFSTASVNDGSGIIFDFFLPKIFSVQRV